MGAREQLVKSKRSLGNQIRGLLRPFGVKLPLRAGMKKFADAAYRAAQADPLLSASINALLEALAAIEAQFEKLDDKLKELARRNEVARRLMSVPGVGPITALAFIATIEKAERFKRTSAPKGRASRSRASSPCCWRGYGRTTRILTLLWPET